jgi:hypothetical protein
MSSSSPTALHTALFDFRGRAVPLHPRSVDRPEEPPPSGALDAAALWEEYRWVAVAVVLLLLLYVALGDDANAPAAANEKECPAGAPVLTPTTTATPSPGSTEQVTASDDGTHASAPGAPSAE